MVIFHSYVSYVSLPEGTFFSKSRVDRSNSKVGASSEYAGGK